MATYCMSDIHGDYDKYIKMLDSIDFCSDDILYVIGDVIDRSSNSMAILQHMMRYPNIIPLIGNHEYMALQCLNKLSQEITDESVDSMTADILQGISEWIDVGGQSTIDDYQRLNKEERQDILDYLGEFELYEEVECGYKVYVLIHAGLENFIPERPLWDYDLSEMIFASPDYSQVYYPDKYLITGHLPTWAISENDNPEKIYRKHNHIAIDCGCGFGGKLAAICLDDGKEYYV